MTKRFLTMSSEGVSSVEHFVAGLRELLFSAHGLKPQGDVEPPLTEHDLQDNVLKIFRHNSVDGSTEDHSQYAAIETACRNVFYELLATTSIKDATFGQVWNLLDIVSILSDTAQCEPGLVFWLVEELLDSQTIEGCRRVFDYLDSRRERITAKHFKEKKLIILRACNELLRRLSRAEDTVFCGRVFIFLFQSFPLGDKSSVNLRGEFHSENVTVYENGDGLGGTKMTEAAAVKPDGIDQVKDAEDGMDMEANDQRNGEGTQSENPDKIQSSQTVDTLSISKDGELYPMFWALQDIFSSPTKAFDDVQFDAFKKGLEATVAKFQAVQQELQARGTTKLTGDSMAGSKRKRGENGDVLSSVNPKYLTSKDLFSLEISDLAFRRHILVQALILVDFLLSLTAKSKKKLENLRNKSVLYSYTLSEENAQWALKIRAEIAVYLQQGPEGKFYYRMIDTVLSRDKNWVHWKAENCVPIERRPVPAADFEQAKKGASAACANRKSRAAPMGSLDLTFLSEMDNIDQLADLKNPQRSAVPAIGSFKRPLADAEFNIEMANTPEEREKAVEGRASVIWKALRIASRNRLQLFDRIEDTKKLDPLFDVARTQAETNGGGDKTENSDEILEIPPSKEAQTERNGMTSLEIPATLTVS